MVYLNFIESACSFISESLYYFSWPTSWSWCCILSSDLIKLWRYGGAKGSWSRYVVSDHHSPWLRSSKNGLRSHLRSPSKEISVLNRSLATSQLMINILFSLALITSLTGAGGNLSWGFPKYVFHSIAYSNFYRKYFVLKYHFTWKRNWIYAKIFSQY